MSRQPKEGRVLQRGIVKAAEIAAGLGLGGPEPETRPPKLSPAQARAKAEGKPVPPSPDGYETVVITGGRDAFEHLGRPDLNSADAGKIDGRRIVSEPPPKPQPQRTNWEAIDGATPALDAAETKLDAVAGREAAKGEVVKLIEDVKADAARARQRFDRARGTPAEAAAIADLKQATALVERTAEKL